MFAKINRTTCCLPEQSVDICNRFGCNAKCPPPITLDIPEIKNSISSLHEEKAFFIEKYDNVLDIRQACSVESLAYHNPNLTIYVLFINQEINIRAKTIQTLVKSYNNIQFIKLDLEDFLAGTPLERWYHCTDRKNGPFDVSQLSNVLQFIPSYKYGGYYFGFDVIQTRPVIYYRNFVAAQDENTLGNCAFHVNREHPVIKMVVDEFLLKHR